MTVNGSGTEPQDDQDRQYVGAHHIGAKLGERGYLLGPEPADVEFEPRAEVADERTWGMAMFARGAPFPLPERAIA